MLEAASLVEDRSVLDDLAARLEAAGFSPVDLRDEGDRVGVFLGVRVPEHGDALDALFRLLDAERLRHEDAGAKIKEAGMRKRATDKREKRERELDERLREKLPPPD